MSETVPPPAPAKAPPAQGRPFDHKPILERVMEPTLFVILITAVSYAVGSAYLDAYYSAYGLSLRSLNLPAADIFFASGIALVGMLPSGLNVFIRDEQTRPSPRYPQRGPAWFRKIPAWVVKVAWLAAIGIVAYVADWKLLGVIFLYFASLVWFDAVDPRDLRFFLLRLFITGMLVWQLAEIVGEENAKGYEQGRERVVLYTNTTPSWDFSGKEMFPLLHRDGLWYVVEPGKHRTHIIPDAAVVRAEQYKPD
jgi:hypothetical protein